MDTTLFIVVPCYKDEAVLPVTGPVFLKKLTELTEKEIVSPESRLLLVNDGSPDGTWEAIRALYEADRRVIGVNLAENTGEETALLAGMFTAVRYADCIITMDSDLQDDIETVDEMIKQYKNGNDIVLGVRSGRNEDSLFERFFSGTFYFIMKITKTGLIPEHANFRLMSKKATDRLKSSARGSFYLPTLVCNIDLPRTVVTHLRFRPAEGESHYSFRKKADLAVRAIVSHGKIPPFPLLRKALKKEDAPVEYEIKEILCR